MVEWSITAVLKTAVLRGTGGSNPSLSAEKRAAKVARFFLLCVCARSEKACMLSYVGYLIGELLLGKTAC